MFSELSFQITQSISWIGRPRLYSFRLGASAVSGLLYVRKAQTFPFEHLKKTEGTKKIVYFPSFFLGLVRISAREHLRRRRSRRRGKKERGKKLTRRNDAFDSFSFGCFLRAKQEGCLADGFCWVSGWVVSLYHVCRHQRDDRLMLTPVASSWFGSRLWTRLVEAAGIFHCKLTLDLNERLTWKLVAWIQFRFDFLKLNTTSFKSDLETGLMDFN